MLGPTNAQKKTIPLEIIVDNTFIGDGRIEDFYIGDIVEVEVSLLGVPVENTNWFTLVIQLERMALLDRSLSVVSVEQIHHNGLER